MVPKLDRQMLLGLYILSLITANGLTYEMSVN